MELSIATIPPTRRGTGALGPAFAGMASRIAVRGPEPAPAGFRGLVGDLAREVADLPPAALAALPPALPALRAAVVDAQWLLSDGHGALAGALQRLAGCLEEAAAGGRVPADRLSAALAGAVTAIVEAPASRSIAVNYALKHLVGVIGAVSGKLLAEGKRVAEAPLAAPAAAPAAASAAASAAAPVPPAAPAPDARRHADYAMVATLCFGGAVACTMAAIGVPEAAIAASLVIVAGTGVFQAVRP